MSNRKSNEIQPIITKLKEFLFNSHEYRVNIISNHLERKPIDSEVWELVQMADVEVELYEFGFKGFKDPLKALFASKHIARFIPFEEYYYNLPKWSPDQDDHIKNLCSFIETDNNEWFYLMFKKWLVRSAGQALGMSTFNKQCLTLVGKQNDGKTSFFDYIVPPILSEYAKKGFDFGSKDGKISLVQNHFIILDELSSFAKKELDNEFKATLSENRVKYRPLFQNVEVSFPRRASFGATTNKFEFLTDETGNVRWLPFIVKSINHDNGGPNGYTSIDINLVWSQVYYLLNDPTFKSEMLPDELKRQEEINRKFLLTTTEMEVISKHYTQGSKEDIKSKFLTASDIEDELRTKTYVRLYRTQIGKALQVLGFRQESVYDKEKGYSTKGYYLNDK